MAANYCCGFNARFPQQEFADAFEELLDVSTSEDDSSMIDKTRISKSALATEAACSQVSPSKAASNPTNGHEAISGELAHN